jgi:hypothetical protein
MAGSMAQYLLVVLAVLKFSGRIGKDMCTNYKLRRNIYEQDV